MTSKDGLEEAPNTSQVKLLSIWETTEPQKSLGASVFFWYRDFIKKDFLILMNATRMVSKTRQGGGFH